jgi:heme iron utilization protein
MPYGLYDEGRPIFLISTMAMHTQNLQADPRASLFVTEPDPSADPLGSPRVTLIGNVTRVLQAELATARTVYLAGYPDSKYWVDFEDFSFYRMDVVDVYYIGGFGVMGWVAPSGYAQAQADPLADHKSDIVQHMNADHKDALILLAKQYAGIEAQDAGLTSIDRLGFHLRLETRDGMKGARIAFLREVGDPAQAREVFIEMVRQRVRDRSSILSGVATLEKWNGFREVTALLERFPLFL